MTDYQRGWNDAIAHIKARLLAKYDLEQDSGKSERVHPGNKDFAAGDRQAKPKKGDGGKGSDPSADGEGEDDFTFTLTRDEFLDLFFDGMELPNLVKKSLGDIKCMKPKRSGYTTSGSPNSLSVIRTMKSALSRRIASGFSQNALDEAVRALSSAVNTNAPESVISVLESRIDELEEKRNSVPFLDDVDLRYRNTVMVPNPTVKAVMFCVMDVSASMGEHHKDLAKRFFTLLYMFLNKKYESVDVVFVRHTSEADEDRRWFPDIAGGNWLENLHFAMRNFKDESFLLQYLSPKVMRDFKMFAVTDDEKDDSYVIKAIHDDEGYKEVRRVMAANKRRDSMLPNIQVKTYRRDYDRALILEHIMEDGKRLEDKAARSVMKHVDRLWGFTVRMDSIDDKGFTAATTTAVP